MTDLFSYPRAPGFKERSTSRDAARAVAGKAATIRADVLRCFRDVWPAGLTAEEVTDMLELDKDAVRPRCSELVAASQILATTVRRPGRSGVLARVWVARRPS